MNLVLFLSYHGGAYHGFQKQPNQPSIQSEIERVLVNLFPQLSKFGNCLTHGAGRTDSGVHANEQVLSIKISSVVLQQIKKISLAKIPQVVNNLLPQEIRILEATFSDKNFNPRYQAQVRCYRYCIFLSEPISSVAYEVNSFYYRVFYQIDLIQLKKYFYYFEGKHDFTSFASWDGKQYRTPVRVVYKIDLIKKGKKILIDIYGGSFLKSMVRSLIGNVLYHYRKGNPPEVIRDILEAKDPSLAKHRVPPQALFLHRVFFIPLFGSRWKSKDDTSHL